MGAGQVVPSHTTPGTRLRDCSSLSPSPPPPPGTKVGEVGKGATNRRHGEGILEAVSPQSGRKLAGT